MNSTRAIRTILVALATVVAPSLACSLGSSPAPEAPPAETPPEAPPDPELGDGVAQADTAEPDAEAPEAAPGEGGAEPTNPDRRRRRRRAPGEPGSPDPAPKDPTKSPAPADGKPEPAPPPPAEEGGTPDDKEEEASKDPKPPGPKPAGIHQVSTSHYRIQRALYDKWKDDPYKLGDAAEAEGGWVLSRIRERHAYHLGMRNKDVVLEVNGHKLNTKAQLLAAYLALKGKDRFEVLFTRNGVPRTYVFEIID